MSTTRTSRPGRTGTGAGRAGWLAKVAALILLSAALFAPGAALAQTREYGNDQQRFTLSVPDGWQEHIQENAIQLKAPDDSCVVSVRIAPREGKRAEALVRKAARDLSVGGIRKLDDNVWAFYVASENIRVLNQLVVMKESVVLMSVAGDEAVGLQILASLRPKD